MIITYKEVQQPYYDDGAAAAAAASEMQVHTKFFAPSIYPMQARSVDFFH
jgi:hypothetical protein